MSRSNPFRRELKVARMRKGRDHFKSFSREEKKTVIGYLLNLIELDSGNRFSEELLSFSVDAIGRKEAYDLLRRSYGEKIGFSDVGGLFDWVIGKLPNPDKNMSVILHELFYPLLEKQYKQPKGRSNREFEKRLGHLQETFDLTDEETAIVQLFYLLNTNIVASNHLGSSPLNFGDIATLRDLGHHVLGLSRKPFLNAVNNGILLDAGLLESDDSLSIASKPRDYLAGIGDRDLQNTYFTIDAKTQLSLKDFALLEEEIQVLRSLLRSSQPCNILFYGEPGTGKTTLAKCLAKECGLDLYCVRISEEQDFHQFRLQAVYATLNAAKKKNAIVLVDEADEILNTQVAAVERNITNKSWVNNLLDNHGKRIIWITNRSRSIDPSTMRRFAYSIEFERLTAHRRLSILKHELKEQGLSAYINDGQLRELCKTYNVDASGIVHAVKLLKLKKTMKKDKVLAMVESILKNHEKVTLGRTANRKKKKDFRSYSLKGLHTSQNLEEISRQLKGFIEAQEREGKRCASLLLYGPPGTGKTEFVHYLGHQTGKDVLLKHTSEIESMFVGEAEKNIARAFSEAKESKSILFFDEADSFLYPRSSAMRSWEKSFTNEILAQLDDYTGIVIFATNDKEGLDHAALRRFKYKVQFSTLLPDGIQHFYSTLLAPLANNAEMSDQELKQLLSIKYLAPGDFAVVRDQAAFNQNNTPSHQDLITALVNEVLHKKASKQVGF